MNYTIVRSHRRTMAIQIKRDGRVVVRAPYAATDEEVRQLVEKHRDWIEKSLARQREAPAASPPKLTEQEMEELRRTMAGDPSGAGGLLGGTDGCFTHGDTDHRRTDPLGQLLRKKQLVLFPVPDALSHGGH